MLLTINNTNLASYKIETRQMTDNLNIVSADKLPDDLWLYIANNVVSSDDPCKSIETLCRTVGAPWIDDGCGDHGWLFEQANRRFGWYGKHADWQTVHAYYISLNLEIKIWRPRSPKAYFLKVCTALRTVTNRQIDAIDIQDVYVGQPYVTELLKACMALSSEELQYIFSNRNDYTEIATVAIKTQPSSALKYVPHTLADYDKLARISVTANANTLRYVTPKTRPSFASLAIIAIRNSVGATALRHVPTNHEMYGKIAIVAVTKWGPAIQLVPTDRADYYEIAKAAVASNCLTLRYIPKEKSYYVEFAKTAVLQNPWVLHDVPTDIPSYWIIAVLAVRAHPDAIDYVPRELQSTIRALV